MHMASAVEQYIVQLVIASRKPARYSQQLAGWIEYGGSPAPPSPWTAAPAPTPGCTARITSAPTMSRRLPPTCCATACC